MDSVIVPILNDELTILSFVVPKDFANRIEMKAAKIDLAYRDFCADLLIPLNKCRRHTFNMPWKCEHERHAYEICQHHE